MDQAALIKRRVAFLRAGDWTGADDPVGGPARLRERLEEAAERIGLSVIEDECLAGTNIEGELNRRDGLVLLRPGLDLHRANFIIGHEIGHLALDHPLHLIVPDTGGELDESVTPEDLSAARQQSITGLDMTDGVLTALRGYNARDRYEMQANAFAAEMLIPEEALCRLLRQTPRLPVADLAAHFGVPVSLVRVAMAQSLRAFTLPPVLPPGPDSTEGQEFTFSAAHAVLDAAPPALLDAEQEAAAYCPSPALVVAGPGAGKTRILVARYARLVKSGVPPRGILALTFANKAASEMRERLAHLVGPEQAAAVEVFTFHGFGLQLLQQYGDKIGLKMPLRLITPLDALLLFRRRASEQAYGFLSDLNKTLENLRLQLQAVARAKEENASPDRWATIAREWHDAFPDQAARDAAHIPDWAGDGLRFYREYQATLRRLGLLDYGDLQTETVRLFENSEVASEIRERYQHLLVDEFQDINFVSGRMVRELDGGRGCVWVVGDPRQSIYGFRGASPLNLSRFRTDEYYPTAQVMPLTGNFRSVPAIVAAGAAIPVPVLGNDPALVPPPLRAFRASDANALHPAVTSVVLPDLDTEMRCLVHTLRDEVEQGVALGGMAVLVRKNKQAAQVADALTRAGIAHNWGGPLESRAGFRLLVSVLRLAVNDTRGIVGLTTLAPGGAFAPDFSLSEADRRLLLADGRGRTRANGLLRLAAAGEIAGLSQSARQTCAAILPLADALSASARPHHNLSVYLFEYAGWLRDLISGGEQDGTSRVLLATIKQTLDLAASFATQRDALARALAQGADQNSGSGDGKDTEIRQREPFALETDTGAFLDYLEAALESGGLGVPDELALGGDAVSVLTTHRAKGLEWPVVFVPFAAGGQFALDPREDKLPVPPGLIETDVETPEEAQAREEACVFYVAVTRARDRLYLSSAEKYGNRRAGAFPLRDALCTALTNAGMLHSPVIKLDSLPCLPRPAELPHDALPLDVPEIVEEFRLRSYEACPRQYIFDHVYGLPTPQSAVLDFHRFVGRAAREVGDGTNPAADFATQWDAHGPPASHWQTPLLHQSGKRAVADMANTLTTAARDGHTVAYKAARMLAVGPLADGARHQVRVTIDEQVKDTNGKTLALRRHKQGARPPQNAPDDDRATLYALCIEDAGENATVAFHYPQAGESLPVTFGAKKKQNRREKLILLLENMKAGNTRPTPGEACKKCGHRLLCEY